MNSSSSHAGLGGRPRIGFTFFTRKGQAAKHSPRHPDIAIDLCTQELLVYDGCSCGPCFSVPFNTLSCEDITALFPADDTAIRGVTLPSELCSALGEFPIGNSITLGNPA